MPVTPPKWTPETLAAAAGKATEVFRQERMTEPLELYSHYFDGARSAVETVLEATVDLLELESAGTELLLEPSTLEVLRYLPGPPISEDDLKTIAEIKLSRSALMRDPTQATAAIDTILLGLDRNRFPWVLESEEPTESERNSAIVATASLIAQRRVMTSRANDGKTAQEDLVKSVLAADGFREVPTRTIHTLSQAPGRGEFCGESPLGSRKADIVLRLWDDRVMAIECKVSNSSTNSVKRLNNDAAVKAVSWLSEFGTAQLVPSSLLAGVFKTHNLVAAQDMGLTIWWSHDLCSMLRWIEQTRP